ncbi:diaminopimelate dehydrogenase [Desulfovibrio litoralis]|uniref:Meso-diaminopimelate D-dehydrogenase n=1 Tax=Desulfovibrio litoralis DSM 11393 TaxID=1121455 RepID=A0A1M7SY12_9BACT|nr:diaminopimelate dehydrogenase [Desulfovibrio litoralis]SHN63286.1 diaminopimelate dehydrogenase [Desulfovibrio litoralis DSM 11393]
MSKIKVIVHGFGNIGKNALLCIKNAPDMECLGIIRRKESIKNNPVETLGFKEFPDFESLKAEKGMPDVAILAAPSRSVPELVTEYLALGVNTVDSFDIHDEIPNLITTVTPLAKRYNKVAICAAGWDPGTDSVLRALFEAMTPAGTTFTNFGRGRSMGHSVAARAIEGVKDATSITIPLGGGRHARLVYVVLEKGVKLEDVEKRIKADAYFSKDPLEVKAVADSFALSQVADNSHGVVLERIGASGAASNQRLSFDMRIDNPALTAQVLVSCVRATTRLKADAYTLIDIPPVAYLLGDRMEHIHRLV